MSAPTMKLKKGDQVKIVAGSDKGKTGKIVAVIPTQRAVKVEGINIIKKHVKPNAAHPQGKDGKKVRVYKVNNKEIDV